MYYTTCPEVTVNWARFPATPTGREVTTIEQAVGSCVEHAVETGGRPTYLCKGDGKWTLAQGACACKPGYEPDAGGRQRCSPCPAGRFKPAAGGEHCGTCPARSAASTAGAAECRCEPGWVRPAADPRSAACTRPPTAPVNLTAAFVDRSTAVLSWLPPERLGGRHDLQYRVRCEPACSPAVTFVPEPPFNDTQVTVAGLAPTTTYVLHVTAENGASEVAPASAATSSSASLTVRTEAAPVDAGTSVRNLRIANIKSQEMTVAWDAPASGPAEAYEVRCWARHDPADPAAPLANASLLLTTDLQLVLAGLEQKTEYGVQVRAKTRRGWGDFGPPVYKTTGQVLDTAYVGGGDEEGLRLRLVAGGIVAVVVLLVAIIVLAVLFLRSRSSDDCNKKQPSDCDTLEYRNGEGTYACMHVRFLDQPPPLYKSMFVP